MRWWCLLTVPAAAALATADAASTRRGQVVAALKRFDQPPRVAPHVSLAHMQTEVGRVDLTIMRPRKGPNVTVGYDDGHTA